MCSDTFFHFLLEKSESVRLLICQSLIEDHQIVETVLENTEFYGTDTAGKKMVLDIVTKDEEGCIYNIEMQVGSIDENDFIRFQCYGTKRLQTQEKRGMDYHTIHNMYQLIISDKNIKELSHYQHDFDMYDYQHGVILPYHKIHMRIIQLPKI